MITAFTTTLYSDSGSYDWTKICLREFRKHFPNSILVIADQNHNPDEIDLVQSFNAKIIKGNRGDQHGTGMDLTASWCKNNDIDVMIHFEPDCLISGSVWYDNLIHEIHKGNWMTGGFQYSFGPIHPCPSAWVVNEIKHTFAYVPKEKDIQHPKFRDVFNTKELMYKLNTELNHYTDFQNWLFTYGWDTAQKNWFECAINKKSSLAKTSDDFIHFWCGSRKTPQQRLKNLSPHLADLLKTHIDLPLI